MIPSVGSVFFGFFKYDGINPLKFVGLRNFVRYLAQDPMGLHSLKVTAYYSLGTLPPCLFLGLAIALVINKRWFKGRQVLTAVYFLPVTISYVAVAFVWSWLLDPMAGVVNYVLESIGLEPQVWFGDPNLALFSILLVSVWKNLGFFVVLYLTALQGIPAMYTEAADLDGANEWQKIRHVLWPLLLPTTFFLIILSVIDSFRVFDQVYILTFGGPENTTRMVAFYVWQEGFTQMHLGYSSAIATILLLIMLLLTTFQWRYYMRRVSFFE